MTGAPPALLLDVEQGRVPGEHCAGERMARLLRRTIANLSGGKHAAPRTVHSHRRERLTVALGQERLRVERPHREWLQAVKCAPGGFRDPWAPLLSIVRDRVEHRHVAFNAGLRRPQMLTAPRAANLHDTGREVYVLPLETRDFAGTHPRRASILDCRKALEDGLRDLGYVHGRQISIDYRFSTGSTETLHQLATELAQRSVDLSIADTNPAVVAAKQATGTIPIVMAASTLAVSRSRRYSRLGNSELRRTAATPLSRRAMSDRVRA